MVVSKVAIQDQYVIELNKVSMADVHTVGGKCASLGEMIQNLCSKGVNVPLGFSTTAFAYRQFLALSGVEDRLRALFEDFDPENLTQLLQVGKSARELLLHTPFPQELSDAIEVSYLELCEVYGRNTDVAVRSSATAEDLPDASFAGQQDTFLNISGAQSVIETCHRCFASLFTDRAISYRQQKGFDHFSIAISVGVQKMVRSDLACSGVMFSIDTETGFRDAALITGAYGLGENIVGGIVNPDEFLVHKPTLLKGFKPILSKKIGSKELRMVYDGNSGTTNQPVPLRLQNQFCMTEEEILKLASWASVIENHYTQVRGEFSPMDIEWAKDGITGELFIVQARPETVQSQKNQNVIRTFRLLSDAPKTSLVRGTASGNSIGSGEVRVITSHEQIHDFQAGEVLVTERTDPDWEPIMKMASAIITNSGGRTCHAAIIARELGVPAVVGCGNATEVLQNEQFVTVTCAQGEEGFIFDGILPFEVSETLIDELPWTKTKILMNVGNPSEAFSQAQIPNHGVGLARTEFTISAIRKHPLAMIRDGESQLFVDLLASGISKIAAAFYPNPVVVRMSDFKSNEYANLAGGSEFEPIEENPMIGWRGASRYYDPKYAPAFALECEAMKKVRDIMGLTNVIPMIPFCRTPDEGRRVITQMRQNGLIQGENNLQIYVMAELPNNFVMAEEFAEIFDGFSIGSNDLTQLTLGLDRDSALVSHLFDERIEGVMRMIKILFEGVKAFEQKTGIRRKIGICGQAPSDFPEFAQFLIELGIDSISLNPDTVLSTRLKIAEFEGKLLSS